MKKLRMVNGDVIDADPKIRLCCTKCHGGDSESPGGRFTKYTRKDTDPKSVVRCVECGKRHSRDSLVDMHAAGFDPEDYRE